eukprot:c12794_g1_i1.p1 GENE.c12794_g1_i1~~c12794_g1_i1.p1  ORF type:complete len:270 (-),score=93.95 c12794_g1_i1:108-917(-)
MKVKLTLLFLLISISYARRVDDEDTDDHPVAQSQNQSNSGESVYIIQHCLSQNCDVIGGQGFEERGRIRCKKNSKGDDVLTIVKNNKLEVDQVKKIESLHMYTVRLVCDESSACGLSKPQGAIYNSISSCWLQNSGFKDEFVLHTSRDGTLISFDYGGHPSVISNVCQSSTSSTTKSFEWKTSAKVAVPKQFERLKFPFPEDVASHASDDEGSSKQKQKAKDEQPTGIMGFLQRYWYLILPLVLMSMFNPGAPAAGAGGAAGGAAGGNK